ncbi:MAG: glycosyl hydrolase, partial [Thermoleophilia bacterium]|nr:glycosyl hydrolase [Thermoleophilia bacterium]
MRRAAPLLLLLAGLVLTPAGGAAPLQGPPARLAIVNYYPADNAWTRMWTRWRPQTLERDFRRIAALRATTVRLIVAPRAFGYPRPRAGRIRRLARAVALAERQGLTVQLTLFDWWGQYGEVERSRRWAEEVLAPFAGDRRIAFVELQNELDATRSDAVAWARALIPAVRAAARRPVALSPRGEPAPGVRLLEAGLGAAR